jgi:hypothetical protein
MLVYQGRKVGSVAFEFPSLPGKQFEIEVIASFGFVFGWSFVDVDHSIWSNWVRSFLLRIFGR